MLRADLADAEAERTRALRLVVGVLGRDRVERALANGGIGSLLRTATAPADRGMGPPSDAGRRSRLNGGRVRDGRRYWRRALAFMPRAGHLGNPH